MFTLPELAAAAELGLGIVVVVVNDGGYGEIRREMLDKGSRRLPWTYGARTSPAAATAFGARGVSTNDSA